MSLLGQVTAVGRRQGGGEGGGGCRHRVGTVEVASWLTAVHKNTESETETRIFVGSFNPLPLRSPELHSASSPPPPPRRHPPLLPAAATRVLLIFQSAHIKAKAEKWRDARQPKKKKGALLIRVMLRCAKHNPPYIIITATL